MLDALTIKQDFPILSKKIHGKELVYLDNSATSQKPKPVVEAISNYYYNHNANVHRGVHQLSDESTQVWETSKQVVAKFLRAKTEELIVVRNTTEALNGIAYGWGDHNLTAEDTILVSLLEHHSNLVVWQELAKRTRCTLQFIKVNKDGRINHEHLEKLLKNASVKLVAITHVSNALGTWVNLDRVTQLTRQYSSARIVVDGAQAAPHMPVDFTKLGVDFYTFSGHKMLGPMGIGGLLVKKSILESEEFRPWLFGGGMIDSVYIDRTLFHEDLNERFVAGTPDVASMVGLAAACEYLADEVGMSQAFEHDQMLVESAIQKLSALDRVELVGPTVVLPGSKQLDRIGSVAFVYKGVHAHDVAQILDGQGVAVRSGHHCTMPLHNHFKWQATIRASFQIYNTEYDLDSLVTALKEVDRIFKI